MAKRIDENLMRKYLDRNAERGLGGDRWEKYFRDKTEQLVELTDGTIFEIEKPTIETRFCFGESEYDIDEKRAEAAEARTNQTLFKIRNLRGIDEKIKTLKEGPEPGFRVWVNTYGGISSHLNIGRDWQIEAVNGPTLELDEENRNRLLDAYEKVRVRFSKRLDAYLRRYGLSKVHAWTYWIDA